MDVNVLVAYSLFITAGITILYVILIIIETKKGIRVGKKIRIYIDQKTTALTKQMGENATLVNVLYERGSDEVEKDLIDPVTRPILKTQQRYTKLKTGEREIGRTEKENTSPHLQKMLVMHKKRMEVGRRRSRKQRKKIRKELQEKEMNQQ